MSKKLCLTAKETRTRLEAGSWYKLAFCRWRLQILFSIFAGNLSLYDMKLELLVHRLFTVQSAHPAPKWLGGVRGQARLVLFTISPFQCSFLVLL